MFRQPCKARDMRRAVFSTGRFDPVLHMRLMREADVWHKRCYLRNELARDVCGPRGDLAFVLQAYRGYFAASTLIGIHDLWLSDELMQSPHT
jgi:hypothetical protein